MSKENIIAAIVHLKGAGDNIPIVETSFFKDYVPDDAKVGKTQFNSYKFDNIFIALYSDLKGKSEQLAPGYDPAKRSIKDLNDKYDRSDFGKTHPLTPAEFKEVLATCYEDVYEVMGQRQRINSIKKNIDAVDKDKIIPLLSATSNTNPHEAELKSLAANLQDRIGPIHDYDGSNVSSQRGGGKDLTLS